MNWFTHIATWLRKGTPIRKNPVVRFDESKVECIFPNGTTQSITWPNLRAIAVETNDQGPWSEDVYFLLFSNFEDQFCSIPQCAEGSQQLISRLQQLSEFNNEALIKAMGCTSNNFFLCWEKQPWVGENWPVVVEERTRWNGQDTPASSAAENLA